MTIDQRACVYVPRVVGARVGQTLQVRNSDELLHNVHGVSAQGNDFNVSQPKAGIVRQLPLKNAEIMLRVTCDVHRWMTAFVGVVNHPYFATTGGAGTFTISNVPAGTYTIQAWHEQFGVVTQTVRVTAGSTSTVDFAYGVRLNSSWLLSASPRSSARDAPRMPSIVTNIALVTGVLVDLVLSPLQANHRPSTVWSTSSHRPP